MLEMQSLKGADAGSPVHEGRGRQSLRTTRTGVALLLINIQNDFMENGAISVPGANDAYVHKLNELRQLVPWDVVVHSRCHYPSNHCAFMSNNPGSQHRNTIRLGDEDVAVVNDHCVQGDPGSFVPQALITSARDIVVERGTDPSERSLGSFLDAGTGLQDFLDLSNVGTVFIAGLPLAQHVQQTAQQALDVGVLPIVVEDLCLDLDRGESELQESILVKSASVKARFNELVRARPPRPSGPPAAFDDTLEFARGRSELAPTVRAWILSESERSWTLQPNPVTGRCLVHDVCCVSHPNAVAVLRMLVEIGVDLNVESKVVEMTPLAYACKFGCSEVVNFLCSKAINARRPDHRGMTPIMHAIQSRELPVVQRLIEKDSAWQLEDTDIYGRTPLMMACEGAGLELDNKDNDDHDHHGHGSVGEGEGEGEDHGILEEDEEEEREGEGQEGGETNGRVVLDWLWSQFPPKHFVDTNCDHGGWQFWHYAVKFDLKHKLRAKLLEIPVAQRRKIVPEELVSLAVWMASEKVKLCSYGVLREIVGIFHQPSDKPTPSPDLDLVIDHVDPEVAFILVEHNLMPYKNQGEKLLLYKALIHGRANVVRAIMVGKGFQGGGLDQNLVKFVKGLRYLKCCTQHFLTTNAMMAQPCYTVTDANGSMVVCCQCVLSCWDGASVEYAGILKSVCECRHESLSRGRQCMCIGNRASGLDDPDTFPSELHPIYKPLQKGLAVRGGGKDKLVVPAHLTVDEFLEHQHPKTLLPFHHVHTFREYALLTFVMSACLHGHHRVLLKLLGDDVKRDWIMEFALDDSCDTCMHKAAEHGHVAVIRVLKLAPPRIACRFDFTQHNASGHLPLTIAAQHGHAAACEALFTREAMLILDAEGFTPLHHAVRHGYAKTVETLAKLYTNSALSGQAGLDDLYFSRHGDKSHSLPTHVPGRALDNSLVAFKHRKAKPGMTECHASALHLAVRYGRPESVGVLIAQHCDPFKRDATCYSPYVTAIWEHHKSRTAFGDERFRASINHQNDPQQPPQRTRVGENEPPVSPTVSAVEVTTPRRRRSSFAPATFMRSASFLRGKGRVRGELFAHPPVIARAIIKSMQQDPRVRARSTRFAVARFYLMSIWYLLMALAYLGFTLPRTSHRYEETRWIENLVNKTEVVELRNSTQVYAFLRERFVSENTLLTRDAPFRPVGVHMLGSVRIRQVRTRLKPTVSDLDDSVVQDISFAKFHLSNEERDGGWEVENASMVFGEAAVYHGSLSSQNLLAGDFGTYSKGGYKVDLHKHDNETNLQLLRTLEAHNWIDRSTRALFVDFSMYNHNLPIVSTARIMFEFAPSGEMPCTMSVLAHRLHDPADLVTDHMTYPSQYFSFLVGLLWLFLALSEFRDIVVNRLEYVYNIGNLYDVANVVSVTVLLYWSLDALRALHDLFPIPQSEWEDPTHFFDVLGVLAKVERITAVLGVVALLIWVRILQYTVYLPTVGPLVRGLTGTLQDPTVVTFTLLLLFFLCGFTVSLRTAVSFLNETHEYGTTFALLFALMLGEWPDAQFSTSLYRIVVLLLMVFVLVMVIVFVNIFISILSEVYPHQNDMANAEYEEGIIALIEKDYVRRVNRLFSVNTRRSWLRVLHLIFVRPVLEMVSRVVGLVLGTGYFVLRRRPPAWLAGISPMSMGFHHEFGWEKGLSDDVKEERRIRWSMQSAGTFREFDGRRK